MEFENNADLESETPKRINIDDSRSEEAQNDSPVTPGDKLCEDELTLIFSNSWISTQDLFNLRLVSKSWRDAATATLLRRDACVVKLHGNSNQAPPFSYNKRGMKTDENKNLSQLTDLISNSKKFPSTNFRIQTSLDTFTHFPDLLKFFELHGNKIKTLRPYGGIGHKCLLDIFFIYSPTLEHLDLSEAEIMSLNEEVNDNEKGLKLEWTSKALPFKSLTLRRLKWFEVCLCRFAQNEGNNPVNDTDENDHCYHYNKNANERQLLHLLLSSPSKLSCIENVTLRTLQFVLKEGKGHLIRSFKYKLEEAYPASASAIQMTKFMTLNQKPKLSKLNLDLKCDWTQRDKFVASWNGLIEFFQDTVENLNISFCYYNDTWSPRLIIPPMKKLMSLTLTLLTWWDVICEDHCRYQCEICHVDYTAIANFREMVFQFQDRISAQHYFPNLMEVSLNSNRVGFTDAGFMRFFSFKSDVDAGGSSANWNCLPKVYILKIKSSGIETNKSDEACEFPTEIETRLFTVSETFPNIQILKLRCGKVWNLSDDMWTLCPNVEFMEIYCIKSVFSREWKEVEMRNFVDSFFTGFSDRMLKYLQSSDAGLQCEATSLEELKFEPRSPSIVDLPRLKELKLMFVGEWSTEFASSVTGVHAFSKMEKTNFIISYDPKSFFKFRKDWDVNWNVYCRNNIVAINDEGNDCEENGDDKIAKYEKLIFGPLIPYVRIVHESQK